MGFTNSVKMETKLILVLKVFLLMRKTSEASDPEEQCLRSLVVVFHRVQTLS